MVTARDGAGNTGTKTVVFRVRATFTGLCNAVKAGVPTKVSSVMVTPLCAKTTAAAADYAAHNVLLAKQDLQDFINLVLLAQLDKKIEIAYGNKLIQWATDLKASI